ncbi:MAG TPA: biopolymer transporter ExbD [Rectinemataceae bacterium]|nr:biopolymer transporter ExbD [Rectinemataceae bacterium]
MRLERRLRVKTAIDMTPLVDVILMLVMFFLITSTFKTAPGIQLSLPTSSTARPISQEPLKVVVVSETEIHVGSAIADLSGLPEAIGREIARIDQKGQPTGAGATAPAAASAASGGAAASGTGAAAPAPPAAQGPDQQQPQRRAIVEAADTVSYQLLVSVLDALRREGVGAVGLATRAAPLPGGAGK